MKLYSYWRSSSAWRVRLVLGLKGVAYEYAPVNLAPGVAENASPGFAEVNPLRQVPTLEWIDEGRVMRLTQSVAIAEFLEQRYPEPALLPANPVSRARVREAVEIVNSGTQPLQNSAVLARVSALASSRAATEWARAVIAQGLAALEAFARAHAGVFVVGDAISLGDVFLSPQLYNARRFEVELGRFPRLVEIDARAAGLPAFQAAHPDAQPDAPQKEP